MAEPIKTKGIDELHALKKRVIRQLASGNIERGDQDNLIDMINRLEAYIIAMPERIPDRVREKTWQPG